MASVKNSGNFVEFDEYVEYQLEKTRQGVKWTDILTALAGVAVLVLGYLFLFVVADHWIFEGGVPGSIRLTAFFVVLGVSLVWLAAKAVRPSWRRVNDLYAARMLEEAEPGLRGQLLGLVDSRRGGRMPAEEVRRALEKRSATTLSGMDVDAALDRRGLMRISYMLLGVVLVVCAYAVFSPKRIGPSLVRAMAPGASVGVATRTEILDVRPKDATVLAGAQLDVSVQLRGEKPKQVWLFYSTADRRFVDEPVEMRLVDETTREYGAALIGDAGRGLTQDLTYRIEAGDAVTKSFLVTVGQPPTATIDSISLQYPAYTQQKPETRALPPIEGVEGTRVELAAKANRPLKSAKIVFADDPGFRQHGEEVPARISEDGLTLMADWTLAIRSDGSSPSFFRIECDDRKGQSNPNPSVFPIKIHPDQPPEITLHDPASDLERPANAVVPLSVSARDPDYELREMTLHLEKQGQPVPGRTVVWEGTQSSVKLTHELPLEPLGLKAGEVLTFYLQASDNREPAPNRRNTQKVNIRITEPVSKEQVDEQLAKDIEKQQRQEAAAAAAPTPDATDAGQEPPAAEQESGEGETGEGKSGGAGEGGKESEGSGESEPDAPVKNDGSQDDEVLRELMRQQREEAQKSETGEGESGQGGETGKEESGAEAGEAGERGSGGAGERKSASDSGKGESGSEGASGSPASPMGGAGDSNAEQGSGTGEGGQPGGTKAGGEEGGAAPQDPAEGTGAGETATGEPGAGERGAGENGTGERGAGTNSPEPAGGDPMGGTPNGSDAKGAAGQTGSNPSETPMDATGGTGGDSAGQESPGEETAASPDGGSEGPKPEGESKGAGEGETGAGETASPGDQSAMPDETRGGQLDASEQGDRIERAPGQSGAEGSGQPPREELPGGENPEPGEGTINQRSQRPEQGEQGAGQPNTAGTPDGATGNGDRTSSEGESGGGGEGETGDGGQESGVGGSESEPGNSGGEGQGGEGSSGEAGTGESPAGAGGGGKGEAGNDASGEGQSGKGEAGEGSAKAGGSGESQPKAGEGGEQKSGGAGETGDGGKESGAGGNEPASENPGGEGQSGEGQSGEGQSTEGQSGEGQSGQGSSSPGEGGQPGEGAAGARTNPMGGTGGSGAGNGATGLEGGEPGENEPSEPNPANEDFAREATNLVLDRLEEDLQRGEIDPELLKELGWTEEDMRRFAERLKSNLAEPTGEESPRDRANRLEFERMLESMSFQSDAAMREATSGRVREVEGVGEVNPTVPTEYRDAYERFTRSVSGFGGGEGGEK